MIGKFNENPERRILEIITLNRQGFSDTSIVTISVLRLFLKISLIIDIGAVTSLKLYLDTPILREDTLYVSDIMKGYIETFKSIQILLVNHQALHYLQFTNFQENAK
jgi:hypothetical protein